MAETDSPTWEMYKESPAYQNLSKARKASTPYAGATLPYKQGYSSIPPAIAKGLVLRSPTASPRSVQPGASIPYRTDEMYKVPQRESMCCGQARAVGPGAMHVARTLYCCSGVV